MNPENERTCEKQLADRLWRAIATIQAMTDRLLAQHEKTASGPRADPYRLSGPAAV